MELSSALLDLLICPATGSKLVYDRENKELISQEAGLAFPIIDGIPILLIEKARKCNETFIKSASESIKKTKITEVA